MRFSAPFLLLLAALTALGGPALAARPPVVVELFTAQGCASCAGANALAGELAERPGIIVLTYSVDYWDYLGWADTFARPEFSDRQRAYVRRLALREPYTPQVVVAGRAQAAGGRAEAVERLVGQAGHQAWNPPDMLMRSDARVAVGSGPAPRGGGEVWLIRYDPREQVVEVRAGDNRGVTVKQRNVVRQIERLGAWTGRPRLYRAPEAPESETGLVTLILVQSSRDGRILGVLKLDPPAAPAAES